MDKILVNISDLKVTQGINILETQSLGSCLGIALYDPITKVAGLAHTMLPDSKTANIESKPGKYVNTAIAEMLKQMVELGAAKGRIIAKIAGGACMFSGASISDFMNIGSRNIDSAKTILAGHKIPIISEDVGAKHGRTVEFHTENGKLVIVSATHPLKEI